MKKPADITVAILQDIRGDIRKTNEELQRTNARLDTLRADTNERLDTLGRRIVESEVRTSTAIADLAGTVRELTGVLRAQAELRPRVERCEHDIADIQRHLGRAS